MRQDLKCVARTLAAYCAAVLAVGCSADINELDATNADLLSASLAAITADMSEADRLTLSQDIAVLDYANQNDGALKSLYPKTGLHQLDFSGLALTMSDQLDGRSVSQLHEAANNVRKEAAREALTRNKERAVNRIEFAEDQIVCDQGGYDSLSEGHWGRSKWMENINRCKSARQFYVALIGRVDSELASLESEDFLETFDQDLMQQVSPSDKCRENKNYLFCPDEIIEKRRQQQDRP